MQVFSEDRIPLRASQATTQPKTYSHQKYRAKQSRFGHSSSRLFVGRFSSAANEAISPSGQGYISVFTLSSREYRHATLDDEIGTT